MTQEAYNMIYSATMNKNVITQQDKNTQSGSINSLSSGMMYILYGFSGLSVCK